jgi:cellobiose-specific phosphotransferase system component IIC
MEKYVMAALSLLLFASFFLLAARAWQKRKQDQTAKFAAPLEALEYFGELIAQSSGLYVATTYAENHLERISAYGLGARGVCQVLVFGEGVLIVRNGERPLAIAKNALDHISANQVAIDKAVEANGLISITWNQNSSSLATHLRIVDRDKRTQIQDAINSLLAQSETGAVSK